MYTNGNNLYNNKLIGVLLLGGSVAQWITRLTTNQEIAGSTPARVVACFFYFNLQTTKQILKVRISRDDVVIVRQLSFTRINIL